MLLRLENVYKSYGAEEILRGVSFQINPGEKVGLVGRNGAGKTTIFRLLLHQEAPDRGQLFRASNLSLGLLEQKHRFVHGTTVLETALAVFHNLREIEQRLQQLEELMSRTDPPRLEPLLEEYSRLQEDYERAEGFTVKARAEAILLGLGFSANDFDLAVDKLSGGQQSRLSLARLLLQMPDLLLLDEPTNHLDIRAIEWLEDFLANYRAAYVIISHDRFLLDRCTNRIIELDAGQAAVYTGNFTSYQEQREERRRAQQHAYEQQQALIERTSEFIRRNLAGQKTKQAKSRRRMLERMDRVAAVTTEQSQANFTVIPIARTGDIVLKVNKLRAGYPDRTLVDNLSFQLSRGEALAIIGGNGTGKSTLLRTLLGRQPELAGESTWGSNVVLGYYDQQLQELNSAHTVIDELRALDLHAEEVKLRNFLAAFNFRGEEIFKRIADLSGGEQGRLALARLIYRKVNVLVLDEPTNHLDIASREALEVALDEFPGTIITVSHDRYFLERIATTIIYLDGESAEVYQGSYSEYDLLRRERAAAAQRQRVVAAQAVRTANKVAAATKTKSKARRVAAVIEQEIATLEATLATISATMGDVAIVRTPQRLVELQKDYEDLTAQLAALYREWETAMEAEV
jgi:ATP-binding cassette, subfamily F, member 3